MKKLFSFLLAGLIAASAVATTASAEGEIKLDSGVTVWEWVEGFSGEEPDKLFDYNETTKWCYSSSWAYCVWEMPKAVEITGYQMVTANDTETYPGRNPLSWTLSGCNNYNFDEGTGDWEVIDDVVGDDVLQGANYTPFTFELSKKAPSYKYYQLEINELKEGTTFQLSGFNLLFEGQAAQEVKTEEEILAEKAAKEAAEAAAHMAELVASGTYVMPKTLKAVAGITFLSGTPGFSDAEGPISLFDYSTATKWCSNSTHAESQPWVAVWEMPEAVAVTGYQLVTGNDTASNETRNPDDWNLYGSNDGENWNLIHAVTGDSVLLAENNLPFDFMLDAAAPAYKFFKYEILKSGGDLIQLSGLNLIFDGAEAAEGETVAPVEVAKPEPEKIDAAAAENGVLESLGGFSGETADKLFDNDTATKWCLNNAAPVFVTWKTDAVKATGYEIVTANDNEANPGRNPGAWTLYGSNDYENWTALDAVENDNVLQDVNFTTFTFAIDAPAEYSYYKFEVTNIVGGGVMQISGLNLLTGDVTPSAPAAAEEETEAPAEETEAPAEETEAPAEETEAPAEETEAPAEETEAPAEETEAPKAEGGCGSFIGGGLVVLMAVLGSAWVSKRK